MDVKTTPAEARVSRPLYTTVAVPLDGTPEAAVAIATAATIAGRIGARLETVTVTRPALAVEKAQRIDEQLRAAEVIVDRRVIDWSAPSASDHVTRRLLGERGTDDTTLVVAASHSAGHLGAVGGSFAEGVLCDTGGPLLLIGQAGDRFGISADRRTLLVAADDPDLDLSFTDMVARWGATFGLAVEFFHADATAATRSAKRDATAGIVVRAHEPDVAAVVIASHTRREIGQPTVGSAAMAVLQKSLCPVLFLRPENAEVDRSPTKRKTNHDYP